MREKMKEREQEIIRPKFLNDTLDWVIKEMLVDMPNTSFSCIYATANAILYTEPFNLVTYEQHDELREYIFSLYKTREICDERGRRNLYKSKMGRGEDRGFIPSYDGIRDMVNGLKLPSFSPGHFDGYNGGGD